MVLKLLRTRLCMAKHCMTASRRRKQEGDDDYMYGKICMTFAKEIIEEKNRRFAKSYMQKALAKGDTRNQIVADLIDICEVLPNKAAELYESYSVVPAEESGFDLKSFHQQKIIEEQLTDHNTSDIRM